MNIWNYRLAFHGPSRRPTGKRRATSLLVAMSLLIAAGLPATTLAQAASVLSVTGTTSSSVSLAWTNPDGIDYFNVYGCDSDTPPCSSGPFIPGSSSLTVTSFTVGGLAPTTTYYYKVVACPGNGACTGADSNIVTATTTGGGGPSSSPISPIGSSAGLTASVNVEQAFVSVTVGLASLVFGSTPGNPNSCMDRNGSSTNGLLAPNGTCDASDQSIEVRVQSNVPSNILVKGSNAVPISGNPGWALCQATGVDAPNPSPCAGTLPSSNFPSTTMPGTDQYRMLLGQLALPTQQALTDTFQCDTNVHVTDCNTPLGPQPLPGNGLPPLTVAAEYARIIGPQTSTDPATIFTTSITWLASQ